MNPVAADITQQVMFMQYSWQQKRHIPNATARGTDQYLRSVEQVSFEYALMLGSLTTETYLKLMESQAQLRLEQAGKLTAIVQDNASVDCSLLTQQWELFSAARQVIFFLPPYSPLQEPY